MRNAILRNQKLSSTSIQSCCCNYFSFCYVVEQIFCDTRILPFQELKSSGIYAFDVMSTERCAKLMVVSMANNLDEVWISDNPALLMLYTKQYLPNLSRWYVLLNVTKLFLWRQQLWPLYYYHLHGQAENRPLENTLSEGRKYMVACEFTLEHKRSARVTDRFALGCSCVWLKGETACWLRRGPFLHDCLLF